MASRSGGRDLSSSDISRILVDSDEEGENLDGSFLSSESDYSENDRDSDGSSSNVSETVLEDSGPSTSTQHSKKRKVDDWEWTESADTELIFKHPFVGASTIKRQSVLDLGDSPTEFDTYRQFLPTSFWESVSIETNRYATFCISKKPDSYWFDTTPGEIEGYFSLCMLMSQVKKSEIHSYWSRRTITATPFFSETMPRKRFYAISKYLHLSNIENEDKNDKLTKIRPVVDFFSKRFPDVYKCEESVSLDESLMKCRGRVSYIQFNPSKRARFGIKLYKLCESSSGYCVSFSIYTGKSDDKGEGPVSESIVLKMMEPYASDGHTVYMDNWYTSPSLFLKLHEKGTNSIGTAKVNRKHMPQKFKKEKKMAKGEVQELFSHGIMALRWMDRKPVTMLSTVHEKAEMLATGKNNRKNGNEVVKPQVVVEYNKGMGGVDRQDQQLASFPIMRRYIKVYKKIFFYLSDMAIFNSYVIFKKITKKNLQYDAYRLNVIEQSFSAVTMPSYKKRGKPASGELHTRIQPNNHFPRYIPPNDKGKTSKEVQSVLHGPECFEIFHTKRSLE